MGELDRVRDGTLFRAKPINEPAGDAIGGDLPALVTWKDADLD